MIQRSYQISCVINLVFGFIKCFFAMQRCNQECFVTKKQVLHIKMNGNFFLHDNQFVQPLSPNSRMPQDCSIATKKLQSITILSWKSFEPDAWLTVKRQEKSSRPFWFRTISDLSKGLCGNAYNELRHLLLCSMEPKELLWTYHPDHHPYDLPLAVVKFDNLLGPSLENLLSCVPITPITASVDSVPKRHQLPSRLAWAFRVVVGGQLWKSTRLW